MLTLVFGLIYVAEGTKATSFDYEISTLEDLKNTFNLSENIVELMPVEDKNIHSKNINNDNGIPFIKGFRGI